MSKVLAERTEWPGMAALILGIVSFAASFAASGIHYMQWEASGEPVCSTPTWIVAWHFVSIAFAVAGVAWIVWAAHKNGQQRRVAPPSPPE